MTDPNLAKSLSHKDSRPALQLRRKPAPLVLLRALVMSTSQQDHLAVSKPILSLGLGTEFPLRHGGQHEALAPPRGKEAGRQGLIVQQMVKVAFSWPEF